MKKYVAYYRVSTKRQNEGLSLDDQQQQVRAFVASKSGELVGEYTEVESARKGTRIAIHQAIEACKESGRDCTLIISKMDRLTRDASFWYVLKSEGVKVLSLDNNSENELMTGMLVLIADIEGKRIRDRVINITKYRMNRGDIIGNPNKLNEYRSKAIEKAREKKNALAAFRNHKAIMDIGALRNDANYTFAKIAEHLNRSKTTTSRGNKWSAKQVQVIYLRHCSSSSNS